jgi:thiol-disulfide isomerase/thioredoxin
VLLNLWATWCAPCVKELPALAKLQGAVPPGKLTVLTVNVGQGGAADTAAFMKAHTASALPVNLDADSSFIRAFGAFGLPLSVLIDPQGREVARAVGPADWDASSSIDYFKALSHAAS